MKAPVTAQKVRGGYYTPPEIAEFLAMWAVRRPSDKVIEPSCGDGHVIAAAAEALMRLGASPISLSAQLCGVEVEPQEARKAVERLRSLGVAAPEAAVIAGDFFRFCLERGCRRTYDSVVGNPPFIRYQNFPEEHRGLALEVMRREGLKPNRLTNAWVPFVVAATTLLRDGGHLAMVLPAELLQVDYASQLRLYLTNTYRRIVVFTFRQLVFDGIQQEVVLLCAERGAVEAPRIDIVELDDARQLTAYEHTPFEDRVQKDLDHSLEKWTQYFLTQKEIGVLRELKKVNDFVKLGSVASVDVGVVTGLNDFFVLTEPERSAAKLDGHVRPVVARSAQLRGLVYRSSDWSGAAAAGQPAHLLNLPAVPSEALPDVAKRYVLAGEEAGSHTGYKCRIRKLWYIVPSVWSPDGFMLRQVHRYPKIVLNEASATCTDTIHRVRFINGASGSQVAAAFMNSATFALSEVMGRSYGGGVLELEPREAERLLIPYEAAVDIDLEELDQLIVADRADDALDLVDQRVLVGVVGMSTSDTKALRAIWRKLQERRIGRKARGRANKSPCSLMRELPSAK